MKKSLREWCKRNSRPARPPYNHLCMTSEVFPRGKTITFTRAFVDHMDELSTPAPDISVDHNRSITEIEHVKKSALRYKATPRIGELAEPVLKHELPTRNYLRISKAALRHITTAREDELAKTKRRPDRRPRDYTKVKRSALSYKASTRIEEISKPPKNKITKKYKWRKPQYVKKSALTATASDRTGEMSKPRDRPDRVTKKNPYEVRKGALTYEASDRIVEISKPKYTTPKYINPEDKWKHRFDREVQTDIPPSNDAKKEN